MPKTATTTAASRRRASAPVSFVELCQGFHTALACVYVLWQRSGELDTADLYERFPKKVRCDALGYDIYMEADIRHAMLKGALTKTEGRKLITALGQAQAAHAAERKRIGLTKIERDLSKARADVDEALTAIAATPARCGADLREKMIVLNESMARGDYCGPKPSYPLNSDVWESLMRDAEALAQRDERALAA